MVLHEVLHSLRRHGGADGMASLGLAFHAAQPRPHATLTCLHEKKRLWFLEPRCLVKENYIRLVNVQPFHEI